MKRFLALGMIAVAFALATRVAAGTNPNTLTLAVFGDLPYWDTTTKPALPKKAEFDATPAFIDTINADPSVQEVVHVGDIHSGSEACTVPYDQAIYDRWTGTVGSVRSRDSRRATTVERLQQGERTRRHGCLRQPGGRAGNPLAPGQPRSRI
jgi:hypothetical protein